MTDERRHFSRARVQLPVTLEPLAGGPSSSHSLIDVSLRGVALSPGAALRPETWCRLTVALADGTVQVHLTGKIIRTSVEGVALQICAADADSFGHLRSIVCYNAEDPEMVDLELEVALRGLTAEA